ncbi:MAG: prolyl oligopeptidase family serine peptidase [Acidobacteriia bacterium]|nr:prolyl oligopeptidase family serine peptidase [Terriglobia bacterium]
MRRKQSLSCFFRSMNALLQATFVVLCILPASAQTPAPPATRQDNVKEVIHGVEIIDPYRWLEEQDGKETRDWVAVQNAYTHSLLDKLPQRAAISKRLLEMFHHDTVGSPVQEAGYYFFTKKGADQDLASIYRRKGAAGTDELLIDPHPMSTDHTTSVGIRDITSDASLMIYAVRRGGEDETEMRIMDLNTRHDLPDVFPRALYMGTSWKKDRSGFYYTLGHRDSGKRIYYHALGSDPAKDPVVFGEGYGPDTWLGNNVSEDGRYLLMNVQAGWAKNELFIQNLNDNGPVHPLITGINAHFTPQFAGDFLIVQTDWQAPRNRILKIDLRDSKPEKWQEIVPATQDAIESFALIGGKLFVNYMHNVTSRIAIFSLEGKPIGEVALPSSGSAVIYGRADQDEGILIFSSYTTPQSIFRYSASTGKRELWYRNAVPFDSDRYEMEQVWYSSKDGTRVPMFLLHRKGYKPDGKTPTILYGYGGFNVSLTPQFRTEAAWWLEQGGIYAVANLRGGSEFGEAWHKAGMLEKKQNVFDDFIAAAEWLVKNKYTTPQKMAIWGGSNGGLLMGAVVTQRPELYQAVICDHPDLDMVRYYKWTRNNNPPALLEYGNAADREQFKFLYAYSPYQHVQPKTKYPAILFSSGDADTRVPPEQARKMTARMQAATSSGRPVLLLYDTKAGHSGGRPFSQIVDELSLKFAFLEWQLGMQ